MKKRYEKPEMMVEDFTVSEMVAADCKLVQTQVTFVYQMNGYGKICSDGQEDYFKGGELGMRGAAYAELCSIYDGAYDMDRDNDVEYGDVRNNGTSDMVFTPAWRSKVVSISKKDSACHVDGSGMTFDSTIVDIQCTTDSSLLQNS